MHKRLKIQICIILISIFQPFVQSSLRLYQLDPEQEDNLIPNLKHILRFQKSEDSGNLKNDLYERRERNYDQADQPLEKSVFVKRIVPHGFRSSSYEYDPKLNTVYKPLVRFHIRKPIDQHNRDILNDIESDQKGTGGFNDALIVLVKNDQNNEIDRSKAKQYSEKDLLRQIQKYLKKNVGKPNGKMKKKLKKRFRGLLGTMKNDQLKLLRTFMLQKSGEEHDPFGPGKVPSFLEKDSDSKTNVPPKPKRILPYYPFWNYWTYQKSIIQDECRGNLIKVGNMCIGSVGHRKSLDEIKKPIKNPRKFGKPLNNINLKKK